MITHQITDLKEYWTSERPDRAEQFDKRIQAKVDDEEFETGCFYGGRFLKRMGPANSFPSIVCRCGNSAFQAAYGDWELNLRCISCGATETVYDG